MADEITRLELLVSPADKNLDPAGSFGKASENFVEATTAINEYNNKTASEKKTALAELSTKISTGLGYMLVGLSAAASSSGGNKDNKNKDNKDKKSKNKR